MSENSASAAPDQAKLDPADAVGDGGKAAQADVNPRLELALRLAAAGYPVLPCHNRTAQPYNVVNYYGNGATTNETQIREWWELASAAWPGIARRHGETEEPLWLTTTDEEVAECLAAPDLVAKVGHSVPPKPEPAPKPAKRKPKPKAKPKAEASTPEPTPPSGLDLDLATTLDELTAIFRGGAYFADGNDYAPETIALHIASRRAWGAVTHNPPILVTTPDPEGGKSSLLARIAAASHNPKMRTNPTAAAIQRSGAERPTYLIDEADTGIFDRALFVGLVNSSHTRDAAKTEKCAEQEDGTFLATEFDYFMPFYFGMIGLPPNRATLSRCIIVQMRTATLQEVKKLPHHRLTAELRQRLEALGRRLEELLAPEIERLAAFEWDAGADVTTSARHYDNWRLQIGICELAGGHWPETGRRAMVRAPRPYSDLAVSILDVAMHWFRHRPKCDLIPSEQLLQRCEDYGLWRAGHQDQTFLRDELAPLGLRTRQRRVSIDGAPSIPKRGYELNDWPDPAGRLMLGVRSVPDRLRGEEEEKEEEKRDKGSGVVDTPKIRDTRDTRDSDAKPLRLNGSARDKTDHDPLRVRDARDSPVQRLIDITD